MLPKHPSVQPDHPPPIPSYKYLSAWWSGWAWRLAVESQEVMNPAKAYISYAQKVLDKSTTAQSCCRRSSGNTACHEPGYSRQHQPPEVQPETQHQGHCPVGGQLLTNIYINLCSGAMVISECPEGPVGTGLSNSLLEQDKLFRFHSRQAAIYITGKTATLNDTSWN